MKGFLQCYEYIVLTKLLVLSLFFSQDKFSKFVNDRLDICHHFFQNNHVKTSLIEFKTCKINPIK